MNKRKFTKVQMADYEILNSELKFKYLTNQKAITLIALVISIIVMLILAGVSLNATIGENGVLTQAKNAKIAQEDAAWDEEAQTIVTAALMGKDDIEELTEEQQTEAGNDADKIEDFKRENMRNYLQARFQEKSNNSVIVSRYAEGYLIVDGERVFIVGKDFDKYMNAKSQRLLVANDEEWTFKEISEGTCAITAYNKELKGTISIPAVLISKESEKAYIVEELGDDIFNYGTQIKKVDFSKVGNTLKRIGARTFMNCTNLEINVPNDLPSSIESIGYKAFYNCKKLSGNIDEIQNTGIVLGQGVFMNCSNLTGSIQNIFDQSFYVEDNGTTSATVIEEGQFSGFSGLTGSLTIPYYITEIKDNAFYGCTGIEALNFDEGENGSQLVAIGNSAFQACTGIKNKLVIPSKVKSIGTYCFYNNVKITGLELNEQLTNIGIYSFAMCYNLSGKLIFPETLGVISYGAFWSSSLSEIDFKYRDNNGCKKIDTFAFISNGNLRNISFPETLQYIGERAFDWSGNLRDIYLPDSINSIAGEAFNGQTKMNIIHWPLNLETIGAQAFNSCSSITLLPNINKLNSIGEEAFKSCTNLGKKENEEKTNIIEWLEKSKITSIGANCFENDIYLTGEFSGTINNSNNKAISISGSIFTNTSITRVSDITNIGNVIANNQYSGSTKFVKNGKEVTEVDIPTGVTSIGENAFAGCISITKIIIPNTVISISSGAFMNCTNLTTIEFTAGSNIEEISSSFCYNNKKLVSISLPGSIKSIGNYAFYNTGLKTFICPKNLTSITSASFQSSTLEEITLNDGLKSLGYRCFRETKLKKIVIPDSVDTMSGAVFEGCSSLESVTLGSGMHEIPSYFVTSSKALKEIVIKGDVTRINYCAFGYNSTLTLNGIKGLDWEKIVYIAEDAFTSCTSLKGTVKVNKECSIHENAANGTSLQFTK